MSHPILDVCVLFNCRIKPRGGGSFRLLVGEYGLHGSTFLGFREAPVRRNLPEFILV